MAALRTFWVRPGARPAPGPPPAAAPSQCRASLVSESAESTRPRRTAAGVMIRVTDTPGPTARKPLSHHDHGIAALG
jgi:hypothetical protein